MRRFRVAVMHGVNLDQLGRRDPAHYGRHTLRELESRVDEWARPLGLSVRFFQSNYEGAFVEYLHRAEGLVDALILNPGAWTHYAWSIRDALEIARMPAVEVHLSDLAAREEWRQHSVISELCIATVSGEGPQGYERALTLLREHLDAHAAPPPVHTKAKPLTAEQIEGSRAGRLEAGTATNADPAPAATINGQAPGTVGDGDADASTTGDIGSTEAETVPAETAAPVTTPEERS